MRIAWAVSLEPSSDSEPAQVAVHLGAWAGVALTPVPIAHIGS
jgi:hypothetical protein